MSVSISRRQGTASELIESVYPEMLRHAERLLARHPLSASIAPGDLVHTAWLKMMSGGRYYRGTHHFSLAMRRVLRLVLRETSRRGCAQKRPESRVRCAVSEELVATPMPLIDILDTRRSLERLQVDAPDEYGVTRLLALEGWTVRETAGRLGISPATVKRRWASTRRRLRGCRSMRSVRPRGARRVEPGA